MRAHRTEFPIRVLGLSPSGYYVWWKRPPSKRARRDDALQRRIEAISKENWGVYAVAGSMRNAGRGESA